MGLVGYEPSCPALDGLELVDVLGVVGVPDAGAVLYFGAYHGLVSFFLQVLRALVQVPPKEYEHPVGCAAGVVDVLIPSELAIKPDSQVICGVSGTHNLAVHEILVEDLVLVGVGDGDDVALFHIELHPQGLAPLG